jgi:addiction module RelB/DinJ family antitoxin
MNTPPYFLFPLGNITSAGSVISDVRQFQLCSFEFTHSENQDCDLCTFGLHSDMAVKETFVRARVDSRLKADSEAILAQLGLTTADAIRIFLHQVRIQRGLPFELKIKEDNSDILLPPSMRNAVLESFYDDEAR